MGNMADTAKNWTIDKAPKKVKLKGDKTKKIESAQHIIEFPGGAIDVARCDDGTYWALIIINRGFGAGDGDGMTSAKGEIVDTRIDFEDPKIGVRDIEPKESFTQIAVRIRSKNGL